MSSVEMVLPGEDKDRQLDAIPPLPERKTKHFFVSSCSEDDEIVFPLIRELEERFHLSGFYSARDFQVGKDIASNVHDGMSVSLKVLLFLSPNFLRSGWCTYETGVAFGMSVEFGNSCIVPVLIEECEIPRNLRTLIYVDATKTRTDIAGKIYEAIVRPEIEDSDFLLLNRRRENGYCYVLGAVREAVWSCRPATYQFVVDSSLCEKLRDHLVEVPEELLQEATGLVNKHSLMSSYDYLSRWKNFLWCWLLLPLLFMLGGITVLCQMDNEYEYSVNQLSYMMSLVFSVVFGVTQLSICCIPYFCHRKKRDISLQRMLWSKIGKKCIANNVLILFTSRRNKTPTLQIMRYNIQKCKKHLVGEIKSRKINDSKDSEEDYADRLIERHLAEVTGTLADDFDFLPDAPINRHNVKKGKMCICQQIENDWLPARRDGERQENFTVSHAYAYEHDMLKLRMSTENKKIA